MRKKSWGRLGAAVGVVALLAGGLVGVAAPAQADDGRCTATGEGANKDQADSSAEIQFAKTCQGYTETSRSTTEPSGETLTWSVEIGGFVLDIPDTVVGADGVTYSSVQPAGDGDPPAGYVAFTGSDGKNYWGIPVTEPVQVAPPPPPCWSAEALNNCPVGGALRFVAPKYAMVGVPVTMYAYASWRPDGNAPSQPTNGTAVIRVDGEDYSGVEFVDGVAEWRFIPETEGMKEFTASGVVFSGLSGANAYIDSVPARTYVLEYDPAAYAKALKNKRVEVGDTYVVTDPNQARSYLEDRYEWSVSEKSDDVCAVYETKKGAVKAKFNGEGKCTVIWMDKESEEEGKYTFIAKK
ncbi:MAG: hypothetical protein GKR85_09800 [Candidatus Nanopelagicales bacterium]|nr:hypothetical protein [Candidatus Nanopelagicales bacterium]